jgi:hypothetical protein
MPTTTSPLTTPRSGFVQPALGSVIVVFSIHKILMIKSLRMIDACELLTGKIGKTKHFDSVNRYIDLFIPLVGHKSFAFLDA